MNVIESLMLNQNYNTATVQGKVQHVIVKYFFRFQAHYQNQTIMRLQQASWNLCFVFNVKFTLIFLHFTIGIIHVQDWNKMTIKTNVSFLFLSRLT